MPIAAKYPGEAGRQSVAGFGSPVPALDVVKRAPVARERSARHQPDVFDAGQRGQPLLEPVPERQAFRAALRLRGLRRIAVDRLWQPPRAGI